MEIAETVGADCPESGHLTLGDGAGFRLVSGDAVGLDEFAQERKIHDGVLPLLRTICPPRQYRTTMEIATPSSELPTSTPSDQNLPVEDRDWLVEGPFLRIEFQHGLAPEVGVNGVRIDDVIDAAITRLERYQRGTLPCRENAEAIDALHRAKDAMGRRRQRRMIQGVFNTYQPHKGERSEDAMEDFSATGA